ncbi:MAG: N-6 DNA methylase, partial [Saprospiraceae bacterium]
MLDTATKKRIDDCRDILVGKLPDPKAQIEQITIGLIYKFMDDMDKEAIELGGKAKFFSGAYKKYSWDNLFDTRVTATEMLRLYSEAIVSMDKNPNIPQLFRDIFKNAFLPYRDPETLKMFLRTISEFEYTHSEKLGDAFEYLLSVMGSQGDAGQFRTPRHIIDFLVAIVDPKKDDTILDPACGTAGFLISAFKHIKEKNNDELTPAERKRLIQNFTGYDISPDMVRLSLVNLYLHGFSDPHIYEYDTLSSEEHWKDNYDVILANPPFMSPKGGIRPHKKFSISSNRSEVLFVDYIAEHLHPHGRAGIIVPEGVIFQSGTAYKELRRMLVDNYLYAVVSLPAGIFNPYSGVKTSILLMDREVAKKSNEILFVKIDNDGFNLGAQRNAIKGGQLEKAIKIIHDFNADGKHPSADIAHAVKKSVIAKSGDYNLSGERYVNSIAVSTVYPMVTLAEVCEINPETIEPSKLKVKEFNYLDISSVHNGTGKVIDNNFIKVSEAPSRARRKVQNNDIALSTVRPNLKAFCFIENPPANTIASTGFAILRSTKVLHPKFLFYNLFTDYMVNQMISM